ncbi:MAG: hypothetical protein PUD59_04990 [bacterium]|nr:hypothetical protein [bacterium]
MKKISILLIVILVITTGCLNYTELNDIGIIDTVGITKNNDNFLININMLTPTTANLEENKTYKVEAKTINEAFDKLYLLTYKDINLSHLELLVLSNKLDKKDYDKINKFFLNRNDSRNTFNVVILNNYNEDSIFKYDSKEINSLIKTNSKEDGIVMPKEFIDMAQDILDLEISYIPTIKVNDSIEILGYSSIYKENKLLTLRESISYNFLTNKIAKCNLVDENLNLKVDKSFTTYKINDNKIKIVIHSTITDYKDEKDIVNVYNKTIKNYLKEYLDNNDLKYFDELIKKFNYNYYKNNKNINIEYDISIDSKLNKEA